MKRKVEPLKWKVLVDTARGRHGRMYRWWELEPTPHTLSRKWNYKSRKAALAAGRAFAKRHGLKLEEK